MLDASPAFLIVSVTVKTFVGVRKLSQLLLKISFCLREGFKQLLDRTCAHDTLRLREVLTPSVSERHSKIAIVKCVLSKKIFKPIKNMLLASRKCEGKTKVYGIYTNPPYYKL